MSQKNKQQHVQQHKQQQVQQQQQLLNTCLRINSLLQLQVQDFSLQYLQHSQWYLQVFSIIYPQLQEKLQQFLEYQNQSKAINQLLKLLSQYEIIEDDFLEIKGQDIIENGDIESMYYVVKLIGALIQRQGEQVQDGQQQDEAQQQAENYGDDFQQEQQTPKHQRNIKNAKVANDPAGKQQKPIPTKNIQLSSNQIIQNTQSITNSITISQQIPTGHNINGKIQNNTGKNGKNKKHSQQFSDDQQEELGKSQQFQGRQQRHSVLGIAHQFQDQQEQNDQEQQEQNMIHRNNQKINKMIKQKEQPVYQNQKGQNQNQKNNIYFNNPQQQTNQQQKNVNNTKQIVKKQLNNDLVQTNIAVGYKNTVINNQKQNFQKPFFSSQDQGQENMFKNNNKKAKVNQIAAKKNTKNNQSRSQQGSGSQDENQYFNTNLQSKGLKKYKSNQNMNNKNSSTQMKIKSNNKKSTVKKIPKMIDNDSNVKSNNKQNYKILSANNIGVIKSPSKKQKKLITHPTIKKQLRKATNLQAKQLTHQVKQNLNKIIKKKSMINGKKQKTMAKKLFQQKQTNVVSQQIERKKKQVTIKLQDWKKQTVLRNQRKNASKITQKQKSQNQLGKILNWKQGQLKKQKQQFQQAMQMKLQVQKQNYIKKINKIILKLEKQKQLQQRSQYKQKMLKQNKQAAKRLTAIQQWYKDRLSMLKQSRQGNRGQRNLLHTGHKEILKTIEKQLKRQNERQIMSMTMKYRKNQAEIENDLEELEREIIKVYKRN